MRAEDGADSPELDAEVASPPAGHLARRDRLIAEQADELVARRDRLIAEQADELVALHTTLLEVRALCDLAEWANGTDHRLDPAMVRVEDVRRILSRPAADPVPPVR